MSIRDEVEAPLVWDPASSREVPEIKITDTEPEVIEKPKRKDELEFALTEDFEEQQEEEKPISSKTEHIELSVEDEARASGWLPKSEYKGQPGKWVDAKTFVERGSFFQKIESLNKRIEEQQKVIANVLGTLTKSEERNYKKALADIQQRQNIAESLNDAKALKTAMTQEAELNKQYQELANSKITPANVNEIPAVDNWKKQNAEILADKSPKGLEVQQDMETASAVYHSKHAKSSTYTVEAELAYVDKVVRSLHPDYEPFKQESHKEIPKVSNVSGSRPTNLSNTRGGGDPESRISRLSPIDQMTARYLLRNKQDWNAYVTEKEKGN